MANDGLLVVFSWVGIIVTIVIIIMIVITIVDNVEANAMKWTNEQPLHRWPEK